MAFDSQVTNVFKTVLGTLYLISSLIESWV